jgi:alginate O-acetyltransferase complex protein AlgI
MVFSSNLFLFVFLPAFLACYYLLPFRFRSALILAFSYVFYGWWRPDFLLLLVGVTLLGYFLTLWMESPAAREYRRALLTFGVVACLATLGYFKYANFGVATLNSLLQAAGWAPLGFAEVVLPIGLSFYIFHVISYMVDVYRGEAPKADHVFDFAAFIAFFPQLVAGPVLRYRPLASQFREREHSWARFARGCTLFMAGFCAKVLLADPLAPLVTAGFEIAQPSMADAWLATAAYTLQLFFDFSGYSTMAVGLGLMVGFEIPKNFDDPYRSASITEFWRRWHISLSTWLREYLYIPLGGNRLGRGRTYVNLLLTMLLGGFWHGANWTFLAWGLWHGGWLALERWALERRGAGARPVLPRPLGVAWTLLLVMLGWVLFRSPDLHSAGRMWAGLFGLSGLGMSPALAWQVTQDQVLTLGCAALMVVALPGLRAREGGPLRWLLLPLFLWAVATLSAQAYTPFLYFQF